MSKVNTHQTGRMSYRVDHPCWANWVTSLVGQALVEPFFLVELDGVGLPSRSVGFVTLDESVRPSELIRLNGLTGQII